MGKLSEKIRYHDNIDVGDLVKKKNGRDWGVVTGVVETPSIVENRVLTVFFTTASMEIPVRAKYVILLQKG